MTLSEFNALSFNSKSSAAWRGEYLGSRDVSECYTLLYIIDDFYVEVYYERNTDTITSIQSFNEIKEILPDINHLLKNIHRKVSNF